MSPTEYQAIVVGGGFGGIHTTYKLRELGYDVHAFEKAPALGGVWYWNKYPGARVDSDVPIYQLWLKQIWKDWNFSERFPGWKELNKYFEHVEKKLDIARNYSFNTFVASCHFNEETGKWTVTTAGEDSGTFICKHLIVCTGFASKKYIPHFEGLDKFKGVMHHTAEWPGETIDFTNKRVAVVGTGASGVQVIQETGPIVKEMTVYQRTPNFALPMRQRKVTVEEQEKRKENYDDVFAATLSEPYASGFEFGFDPRSALAVSPEEREQHFQDCWDKGGFHFWVANFHDIWSDEKADSYAYEFWRRQVLKRLTRPELFEKLAPKVAPSTFVGKRPCLEQKYYEVYNQPNIDVVPLKEDPIIEFTEKGIKTASGEKEFDIIVLATGFDAVTGGLLQMDIRGKNGLALSEKWGPRVQAYLGVSINEFPNMYFMYGPQGPTAFSNGPTCAQIQSNWIIDFLQYVDKNNFKFVEPALEAENAWSDTCNELQAKTLVAKANTWYTGANIPGKKVEALNYIGGVPQYNRELKKEAAEGYTHFVKVAN